MNQIVETMRLTIFAVPHDNFRRQDIKDVSQNHVLYKPEIHGPYKMLTEFLSWFYSQRNLCVVTQFPNLLNAVGHLIYDQLIDHKDVEIILINKDNSCKSFFYDEEGVIFDWEFGTFENFDDLTELAKHYQSIHS